MIASTPAQDREPPTAQVMSPVEMAERLTAAHGDSLPGGGPLLVRHLAEGHSNLTYVVSRVGIETEWILRRPPYGPLLPSAHDVLREFQVISLLAGTAARVPVPVLAADADGALLAPYYLMERTPGTVVRESLPEWLGEPQRRLLGEDLIATLIELHSVDPAPLVEARLGRPTGYLQRQLARWSSQREGIKPYAAAVGLEARELPDYDWLLEWLTQNLPPDEQPAAVVHGDFKLDNVIVDPATSRIRAVLDWEMATVGDPLADLGYLLFMSPRPGEINSFMVANGDVMTQPGFPAPEEWIATYAQRSGRDLSRLPYYLVLAGWKLAVLLEMSYHRWLAGLADDPFFPQLEWGVPALLARARAHAEGA